MDEAEKKMLKAAVLAIDHILDRLALGAGVFDWEDSRQRWHEQTQEVRSILDAKRAKSDG